MSERLGRDHDNLQSTTPRARERLQARAEVAGWEDLKGHLLAARLDGDGVAEMMGHIRRSNDFLIRRADAEREGKRSVFINELARFLGATVFTDAAASLEGEVAVIRRIEEGYREIMRAQEATVAAKLPPETQAAAALKRVAQAYQKMTEEVEASLSRRKELGPQDGRVQATDREAARAGEGGVLLSP